MMNFKQAIAAGFSNYVKFSGRAALMEFWYWIVFTIFGAMAASVLDALLFPDISLLSPIADLFALLVLLPTAAAGVRRLHDIDRTGWWILLSLVPIIGLVLIFWLIQPGTTGTNRFGAPPLRYDAMGSSSA